MGRVWTILKRIGKFLLWTLLVLVVLIGGFVIWLRAGSGEVAECEAGLRRFETDLHVSCIPEQVERVVPFSPSSTQFFLAIGYQPAGHLTIVDQVAFIDQPELVEPWNEIVEGTETITLGESWPPNLESTLAAEPDVILSEYGLSFVSKLVEQIAPVVELNQTQWKETVRYVGDVVGEGEAAEALLADYEERVEILRAQFDDPAAITVSAVNVRPERVVLHLSESFASQIIADVGFSFPEAQAQLEAELELEYSSYYDVSAERYDLLDGDVIFFYGLETASFEQDVGYVAGDGSIVAALLNDPIVQQLGAVERGDTYPAGNYWQRGGIYSAHAVLDDLFRYVAEVDPDEVAPNPLKVR